MLPTESDELPEPVPAAFDLLSAHLSAWPHLPPCLLKSWSGPRAVVCGDREAITPSHAASRQVTPVPQWSELREYHAAIACA